MAAGCMSDAAGTRPGDGVQPGHAGKVGEVPNTLRVHGATASPKSGHGFASSNPIVMFDSKTLETIKTIDVKGSPDGYMYDRSTTASTF